MKVGTLHNYKKMCPPPWPPNRLSTGPLAHAIGVPILRSHSGLKSLAASRTNGPWLSMSWSHHGNHERWDLRTPKGLPDMEETQRTDHFRIGKTHIKLNLMDIFRSHIHILGLPRAFPTPNPHPPPTIHPPPQAVAPSCKRPRGRRRSSRPAPPAAPGAARDAAHVARPSGSAPPGGG